MAVNPPRLLLSSSPHFSAPFATPQIMAAVLLALAPVTVFGVVLYGWPALLTIIVSVGSAIGGESLFRLAIRQKPRIGDLSAAVTGLLLALILPPSTPLWMTALGAVFAVVVAKEFFGGLGANVFNPALIGRAFLIMSFPASLTTWHRPQGFQALTDATTSATPLAIAKFGGGVEAVGQNFAATGLSSSANYGAIIKALFLGNRAGCIGESSILLILVGALALLIFKVIDWRAPAAMIGSAFLLAFLLGLDPLFSLLSGGLIFGACFMATDYVSAPVTSLGKLIFGAGAGIITVLIRKWGGYPEGVTYGILMMNAVAPFLNKLVARKYGYVAPKKAGAK